MVARMILKWMPPQRMVVTKMIQMSRPPPRKVVTSILKSMHHHDQSIDFRSHHDHCRHLLHLLHLRFQICLEIMSIRTGTSTLTCSFRWFTSTIVASLYIFLCILLRGRTIYDSHITVTTRPESRLLSSAFLGFGLPNRAVAGSLFKHTSKKFSKKHPPLRR